MKLSNSYCMRYPLPFTAIFFSLLMAKSLSAQELRLYVLNRGGDNIVSVPFGTPTDNPNIEISEDVLAAYDFVLDPNISKIYWTNTISHQILLSQDGIGGNGQAINSDIAIPVDLEIDPLNNKIYWADNQHGRIFRSNLDGSGNEVVTPDSLGDLSAFALFSSGNKMFFSRLDSNMIFSSAVDGTSATVFVKGDMVSPVRLLVDTIQQKLYWSDDGQNRIERINLDGTGREVVYQGASHEFPFGLLIDQLSSHLLWTDYGTDQVMMAQLDGSNPVPLITTGIIDPVAILLAHKDGKRLGERKEDDLNSHVEPSIAVYPNPANNILKIASLVSTQAIESVRIFDWTGKAVFSENTNDTTLSVDIDLFPPGQYSYLVTVSGKQISGLFSIVR